MIDYLPAAQTDKFLFHNIITIYRQSCGCLYYIYVLANVDNLLDALRIGTFKDFFEFSFHFLVS